MDEMLRMIRNVLYNDSDPDDVGEKLWHVFTALRGPDNDPFGEGGLVKDATTCVIRYFFLGRGTHTMHGSLVYEDNEDFAKLRRKIGEEAGSVGPHFVSHAQKAFAALNLKWNETNQ